ncbi:hypothetical protein WJX84_007904 [Apatococcus fuscideae]|uniref:YdbS-like PH domain-containing protein n=1 Tax=Apatococcus fuscideae TaxID=2026836 RepID=A0AAW1T0J1_9CHLO
MSKGEQKQPLLSEEQPPEQESPPSRSSSNLGSLNSIRTREPDVIWEGTTWQACPSYCACFAPLCCSTWRWRITTQRIDLTHGWLGSAEEGIDLRRIVDIHYERSIPQMLVNRGTIVIHSDNDSFPRLELATFRTRKIFQELREACSKAKQTTAVDAHAIAGQGL